MTHLHPRNPAPRRAVRGVSLLEVLIAVLILAIGMLGIAALQALTLKNTEGSSERSNAVVQSYSMLDMMRANSAAARAGNYDTGMLCEAPAGGGTRISNDRARWITQLKQSVGPTACGSIDCGTVQCSITVEWEDRWSDRRESEADAVEKQTLVTVSRL